MDRTTYSERLSNLVDHLLIPDPNIRPKIDMVRLVVSQLAFAHRFPFRVGVLG